MSTVTTPVQLPAPRKAHKGLPLAEEQPPAEAAARRARPGTTAPEPTAGLPR